MEHFDNSNLNEQKVAEDFIRKALGNTSEIFLAWVRNGGNVLVCGNPGSGKRTFLQALMDFVGVNPVNGNDKKLFVDTSCVSNENFSTIKMLTAEDNMQIFYANNRGDVKFVREKVGAGAHQTMIVTLNVAHKASYVSFILDDNNSAVIFDEKGTEGQQTKDNK